MWNSICELAPEALLLSLLANLLQLVVVRHTNQRYAALSRLAEGFSIGWTNAQRRLEELSR